MSLRGAQRRGNLTKKVEIATLPLVVRNDNLLVEIATLPLVARNDIFPEIASTC